MDSLSPDVDMLRQLYEQSPAAKAFFEHAARRERDQSETKVDRILLLLRAEGHEFRRREILDLFRRMQEHGLGQFVEGRRGWPSRFVWSTGMRSVGQAAIGDPQSIRQISTEDLALDESGDETNEFQSDASDIETTNGSEIEELGEVGGTGLEEEQEDTAVSFEITEPFDQLEFA